MPTDFMIQPVDQLYEAHHGMVFRTAYRITGNSADAEDVLQTVFLRMVRGNPQMDHPESYLRRSAVNAALDVVRARRDTLRRDLSRLPPRTAEMFALRFFEGYTNPEIAKLLGVSQVVVAVTLHRTRNKLKKVMGGSR